MSEPPRQKTPDTPTPDTAAPDTPTPDTPGRPTSTPPPAPPEPPPPPSTRPGSRGRNVAIVLLVLITLLVAAFVTVQFVLSAPSATPRQTEFEVLPGWGGARVAQSGAKCRPGGTLLARSTP